MKFIDTAQLLKLAQPMKNNDYGNYLIEIARSPQQIP